MSSRDTSPIGTDEDEETTGPGGGGRTTTTTTNGHGLEMKGTLSKWTNYIHGWQDRFILLKNSTLTYYKSEQELGFGCRGAISIGKANIKAHEFDDCRFDISVNDCAWYLRAGSAEERGKWVESLEQCKIESGYGSECSLRRHGSTLSIGSNTLSTASEGRSLKTKLAELETYRDILVQQIEALQRYFDACAAHFVCDDDVVGADPRQEVQLRELSERLLPSGLRPIDFRGEALTFKATTTGVLTAVSHCIDVMAQKEELWKKRVEREVEKRRRVEETFKEALRTAQEQRKMVLIGPDCEEGPHSALKDDEFYDAVEQGLDRLEEEAAFREKLKSLETVSKGVAEAHPLWEEINRVTLEQLHYARIGVEEGIWELFAQDGKMRMYKREEEINGLVVDPLKAVHTVKGVTAHEMCHYFFAPEVRMEWETTLDQTTILENISDNTIIFLQIHKRVWPSTQRDAVFWSHKRHVPDDKDPEGQPIWIVCNHSTEHANAPMKQNGKYIRVFLTVGLVCQTVIDPPKNGAPVTRDNLTCNITYCSVVNPGGWAPASVLRAVYKREYPRFLKRFTQYVHDKCKKKPIMF